MRKCIQFKYKKSHKNDCNGYISAETLQTEKENNHCDKDIHFKDIQTMYVCTFVCGVCLHILIR